MDKFIFSIDFIVLDIEEDGEIPLILRWPFFATKRMLIDVQLGKLILRVDNEHATFNIFKTMEFSYEVYYCFQTSDMDVVVVETYMVGFLSCHLR